MFNRTCLYFTLFIEPFCCFTNHLRYWCIQKTYAFTFIRCAANETLVAVITRADIIVDSPRNNWAQLETLRRTEEKIQFKFQHFPNETLFVRLFCLLSTISLNTDGVVYQSHWKWAQQIVKTIVKVWSKKWNKWKDIRLVAKLFFSIYSQNPVENSSILNFTRANLNFPLFSRCVFVCAHDTYETQIYSGYKFVAASQAFDMYDVLYFRGCLCELNSDNECG